MTIVYNRIKLGKKEKPVLSKTQKNYYENMMESWIVSKYRRSQPGTAIIVSKPLGVGSPCGHSQGIL